MTTTGIQERPSETSLDGALGGLGRDAAFQYPSGERIRGGYDVHGAPTGDGNYRIVVVIRHVDDYGEAHREAEAPTYSRALALALAGFPFHAPVPAPVPSLDDFVGGLREDHGFHFSVTTGEGEFFAYVESDATCGYGATGEATGPTRSLALLAALSRIPGYRPPGSPPRVQDDLGDRALEFAVAFALRNRECAAEGGWWRHYAEMRGLGEAFSRLSPFLDAASVPAVRDLAYGNAKKFAGARRLLEERTRSRGLAEVAEALSRS